MEASSTRYACSAYPCQEAGVGRDRGVTPIEHQDNRSLRGRAKINSLVSSLSVCCKSRNRLDAPIETHARQPEVPPKLNIEHIKEVVTSAHEPKSSDIGHNDPCNALQRMSLEPWQQEGFIDTPKRHSGGLTTPQRILGHAYQLDAHGLRQVLEEADSLGEGAYSQVIRPLIDADIAVSVALDNKVESSFFRNKIMALSLFEAAQLEHRLLMKPLRVVVSEHCFPGQVFGVDKLYGESLVDAFEKGFQATPQHLMQVGEAIGWLHSHGVVHRDIKIDNIMLAEPLADQAGEQHLVLGDFGFMAPMTQSLGACAYQLIVTSESYKSLCALNPGNQLHLNSRIKKLFDLTVIKGSVEYVSPALLTEGHAYEPADDIYSFAVCLLKMTTHKAFYKFQRNGGRFCRDEIIGKNNALHNLLNTSPITCQNGRVLSEPFVALLRHMVANVEQCEGKKINDIHVYLSQLKDIVKAPGIYA